MKNQIIAAICLGMLCGSQLTSAQTVAGKINAKTNTATLIYNGTTLQTIPNATAFNNQEVFNLTIDNPAGVNTAGGSYLNVFGALSLLNGNYTTAGSLYLYGSIVTGAGKIHPGNNIIGMFGTTAQTLPLGAFNNNRVGILYINNPNGVTANSWGGVNTTLTLQSGTLSLGGTFIISGGINYTAGGINAGTDTVKFAGSAAQTIPAGAFIDNTVAKLAIANNNGLTSAGALAVTNCLNVYGTTTGVTALAAPAKTVNITGCKLVISSFHTTPSVGQTYTIVSCGTLTGTFSGVTLPAGITGTLSYTTGAAVLTITDNGSALSGAAFKSASATTRTPSLIVYPNPVVNEVWVAHSKAAANAVLTLVDSKGNKVWTKKPAPGATRTNMQVQHLAHGTYFLSFMNGHAIQTQTLIK